MVCKQKDRSVMTVEFIFLALLRCLLMEFDLVIAVENGDEDV